MEKSEVMHSNEKLNYLADQYLELLLNKERTKAEKVILSNVNGSNSIKEIYLNVFQPVLWEVGNLWEQKKISVAMEHYCTAVTQFIMSKFYERIFSTEKNGRNLTATSVSGELHEVGIRMVSDFFELEGWNTYFLGANTTNDNIIKTIKETNSEILAISSTIDFNIPKVINLIKVVREEIPNKELKIIVGGKPFNMDKNLWKTMNADGYAPNAQAAIALANTLLESN